MEILKDDFHLEFYAGKSFLYYQNLNIFEHMRVDWNVHKLNKIKM